MSVSLTAEMIDLVEAGLTSGEYASASEVVRDALRLLRREKAVKREKLEILRREVGAGLQDAAAHRFSDRTVMDIAEMVLREEAGGA